MTTRSGRLSTIVKWLMGSPDTLPLTSIGLFYILFFPQALFGGKYLIVQDAFYYSYPMHAVAWRMLRRGQLPLWSPHTLSGYPLLSKVQLGLGYPLTWGHAFLPPYVAEQIYVLAPFLLAAIFTYLYVRSLGRSPLAALLAGLSFGFGGFMASPLANGGMITNTVMWLPLLLTAIERARNHRFVPCLLLATGAYSMSVLSGFGQLFLTVGLLAFAYGVFVSLSGRSSGNRLFSLQTWSPLLVVCGAGLLAIGIAAWQILETAGAVGLSVRHTLTYQIFTQGSITPGELWQSIAAPFLTSVDVYAFVPPVALLLAGFGLISYFRGRGSRDPRVVFWLCAAGLSCLLMLGEHTPFYRVIYYLPLVNLFRIPARHSFEWTFAIAVLSAFGWDELAGWFRARRGNAAIGISWSFVALAAVAIVAGIIWWLKVQTYPLTMTGWRVTLSYLLWKSLFVALTGAALWKAAMIAKTASRRRVLLMMVLAVCFFEPSALVFRWWGNAGMPAARFQNPGQATQYLQQFPASEHRVYTRVAMTEQGELQPRFDAANFSAVFDLQNVAGYEPLIFDRYSRALGGVGPDSVLRFSAPTPDDSLLTARSHVLDILNTSFLVSYANLAVIPERGISDGNIFADLRLPGEVQPQATATLTVSPTEADSLLLVTSLANSVLIPQGTPVAKIRVHTTEGIFERDVRAGIDTAEWAHDRPDVRAVIKHDLAPIFDQNGIEGPQSFAAYRYKTQLQFAKPERVTEIEILNVTQAAPLAIYLGHLINSKSKSEVALGFRPADHWQPVYQKNDTLILRNGRAAPRAWLVAEAQAVAAEEALRRIRGESVNDFDPRRTALLELNTNELPQLPGGLMAADSAARITSYEANQLRIETTAPTASMLILSEIFYPGWVATLDGQPARIYVADYLLRGISLPPGQHVVEMHYAAPGARNGAIISALTLVLIAGLGFYAWRTRAFAK